MFKCWKYIGVKVWQSHFKEITELNFVDNILDNIDNTSFFN